MNTSLVTQIAPDFEAEALVKGSISKIKLSQFKGKFVVLLFYPLDLYTCPFIIAPLYALLRLLLSMKS